jgi:hypothetical protein
MVRPNFLILFTVVVRQLDFMAAALARRHFKKWSLQSISPLPPASISSGANTYFCQ